MQICTDERFCFCCSSFFNARNIPSARSFYIHCFISARNFYPDTLHGTHRAHSLPAASHYSISPLPSPHPSVLFYVLNVVIADAVCLYPQRAFTVIRLLHILVTVTIRPVSSLPCTSNYSLRCCATYSFLHYCSRNISGFAHLERTECGCVYLYTSLKVLAVFVNLD